MLIGHKKGGWCVCVGEVKAYKSIKKGRINQPLGDHKGFAMKYHGVIYLFCSFTFAYLKMEWSDRINTVLRP